MLGEYIRKQEAKAAQKQQFEKYVEFITLIAKVVNLIESSEITEIGTGKRRIAECPCAAGPTVFAQLLELVPGEHLVGGDYHECPKLSGSLQQIVQKSIGLSSDKAYDFVQALIRR